MNTTTTTAAALKEKLQAAEARVAELTRGYPDLPHDEQRACMLTLENTMKQLSQLREELAEAEKRELGAFTVQILGLEPFTVPSIILDLETSFQQYQNSLINQGFGCMSKPVYLPDGFSVATEHNHIVDMAAGGHLKPLTEYFLHFAKHEDVCLVLGAKTITIPLFWNGGNSPQARQSIQFVQPARDAATRALWRSIGEHIERVKAIDAEFLKMNVHREHGQPMLPKDVLDKSFFLDPKNLPQWESTRAAGGVLGHHAFAYLRSYTPINAATLQARITTLYNEQCDALIQLRKHQLAGLEFRF